ncbi:hypothetical protein [Pedobacter sp.]
MKSLIAVQGTAQFITAYIAFLWHEEKILKEKSEAVLLVYDTSVPEDEDLFKNSILSMASIQEWHKIVFISTEEMKKISSNIYAKCISKLVTKLDEANFDNIYIARDFGSFGTQLIINSYPSSVKIEYGDSFGLIGNQDELKITMAVFFNNPLMIAKTIIKQLIYLQFPSRFNFDLTILSIPLIWDRRYLKGKNIVIPEMKFVRSVFSRLANQFTDLQIFCESLLYTSEAKPNVYLLSNLYNSGFSTIKNEVDLYEEVIFETAKPGQTIILKNHPRGSNIIMQSLKERLSKNFIVLLVDDERFKFLPIELWEKLFQRAIIYPIFSSSVISLRYLFATNVVMSLNDEKIFRYIFPNKVAESIHSEEMCHEASDALFNWDEKSPLWIRKDT